MNVDTSSEESSPSHIVSSESHWSQSASIYIWLQSVSRAFREDSSQIQSPSQTVTLTFSQDQVTQYNLPTDPHPSDYIVQQHYPVQEDTSLIRVPPSPQYVASVTQSQDQVVRLNTRYKCPICWKQFSRKQELKRHLLSYLPHYIHCPFPCCPWTGNRRYSLAKHTKVHPDVNSGRQQMWEESQTYDPRKLVESMASGTMAVEKAVDIALSMVETRFAKPDKVGVRVNVVAKRGRARGNDKGG